MKTLLIVLLGTMLAEAQLAVTAAPPKVAGNKAVVPLAMKNDFAEEIESARAAVFVRNDKWKMVDVAKVEQMHSATK